MTVPKILLIFLFIFIALIILKRYPNKWWSKLSCHHIGPTPYLTDTERSYLLRWSLYGLKSAITIMAVILLTTYSASKLFPNVLNNLYFVGVFNFALPLLLGMSILGGLYCFILAFFKKKDKLEELMDNAAFLSPGYFRGNKPRLKQNNVYLEWSYIEKVKKDDVGALILKDRNDNCLGILKTYTYLLPLDDGSKFLIWNRALKKELGRQTLIIELYETEKLKPIKNKEQKIVELKDVNNTFYFSSHATATLEININPELEVQRIEFSDGLKNLDEFIVITEVANLYGNTNELWHDTALIIFRPKDNLILLYPQDWFNKSDEDFGYVWITRATRNPKTGLIHGQGIRISNFILDKTNRQLLK